MKFDVTNLGIRVIANSTMSRYPSLCRPQGIEGTVLFIKSNLDYYEKIRYMVKMGMVIELACAPEIDVIAEIKVRWDNNRCAWHNQGSLVYRYSKGPRCNRIWFNNKFLISESNVPISMLKIKTISRIPKKFKAPWGEKEWSSAIRNISTLTYSNSRGASLSYLEHGLKNTYQLSKPNKKHTYYLEDESTVSHKKLANSNFFKKYAIKKEPNPCMELNELDFSKELESTIEPELPHYSLKKETFNPFITATKDSKNSKKIKSTLEINKLIKKPVINPISPEEMRKIKKANSTSLREFLNKKEKKRRRKV